MRRRVTVAFIHNETHKRTSTITFDTSKGDPIGFGEDDDKAFHDWVKPIAGDNHYYFRSSDKTSKIRNTRR